VLTSSVAAVSTGIVDGEVMLDLDYPEDSRAEVDLNVVLTGTGRFVEVQGTAERGTFDDTQLSGMLEVAKMGLERLRVLQRESLGGKWPLDT
jgi:ribonuclease PH